MTILTNPNLEVIEIKVFVNGRMVWNIQWTLMGPQIVLFNSQEKEANDV